MKNKTDEIVVTRHANKRIIQRCGVRKKGTDRLAHIAYEKGIPREGCKGELRRYVDKVFKSRFVGDNMRIYGDKIYLFEGPYLVTVLQIPQNMIHSNVRSKDDRRMYRATLYENRIIEGACTQDMLQQAPAWI